MSVKHVSFDVWNTLISANREFATARTSLIAQAFRTSEANTREVYTYVKKQADDISELHGLGMCTELLYGTLADAMHFAGSPCVDDVDLGELREQIDQLFLSHPPHTYPAVREMMDEIRDRSLTVSIGSNSNFISGTLMGPWIAEQYGPFNFMLFSDLLGIAKPNVEFFTKIRESAHVDSSNIVHVGDSVVCDKHGAESAGMFSVLVSSPSAVNMMCLPPTAF